ncbi:MAG: nucleoside hydrolase [Hyphomicrobium sp.]|uniref:nucleoside hydrolase n=1 Tax=Hyphomicrobium sp. TaxID=82 RepID=UPI003D0D2770
MASSNDTPSPAVIISDLSDFADDNIAILMLLRSGTLDVRGVITTSGNVCAHRGAIEARRLLDSAGASVPVVRGFSLAWHQDRRRFYDEVQKPTRPANAYAGALGDSSTCADSSGAGGPQPDAADFLIAQARGAKSGLTIILMGPATVLAEALRRDRELPSFIRRVDAMGGAIRVPGNVAPRAEFNVWFDAEAMASVLATPIPVTLVPLDVTTTVDYGGSEQAQPPSSGFAAEHLAAYLEKLGRRRKPVPMWDEVLAAIVINPDLIEAVEDLPLIISIERDAHYGEILVSRAARDGAPRTVRVVTKVRADGVRRLVYHLLWNQE